ncbi:MAG: hypothetical protein JJV88_00465 [Sulfurovum sp.]|nr:hypothetical protein [Sulfurovaceae bacterium]
MKRKKNSICIILISILLGGCESINNSSNTLDSNYQASKQSAIVGTAFYIDSAIEGVTVQSKSTVSITNKQGKFTFEVGQDCSFLIGDILLSKRGGISLDKMVLEDNIKTAQFLQSLDNDNYAENGITITEDVTNMLISHNIVKVPQTQDELASIISMLQQSNIGFGGDIVDENDAQDHLNWTKNRINNLPYFKTDL